MAIESTQEQPSYVVHADGTVLLNRAGFEAQARYKEALAAHHRLSRSWAGATLAALFLQHGWLEAITLSFDVSPEYDDSGGFYRSILCRPSQPRAVAGHALPEDAFPDGTFDPDAATDLVDQALEDSAFDLYAGLGGRSDGFDDLTVSLARDPVAALLQSSPVDGALACAAWELPLSPDA